MQFRKINIMVTDALIAQQGAIINNDIFHSSILVSTPDGLVPYMWGAIWKQTMSGII